MKRESIIWTYQSRPFFGVLVPIPFLIAPGDSFASITPYWAPETAGKALTRHRSLSYFEIKSRRSESQKEED